MSLLEEFINDAENDQTIDEEAVEAYLLDYTSRLEKEFEKCTENLRNKAYHAFEGEDIGRYDAVCDTIDGIKMWFRDLTSIS